MFYIINSKGGMTVRNNLIKALERNYRVEIVYLANDGSVSKRKIKVIQVGDKSFRGYCYLRKSSRTFNFDNILALMPVIQREQVVV